MYTITISNLDPFEADHVAQILNDYKCKMLMKKMEAMIEDHREGSGNRVEWFDEHISWHEEIMKKVVFDKKS